MKTPQPWFPNDRLLWVGNSDDRFIIRSAYPMGKDKLFMGNENWELLYGALLWNIWLTRNAIVFNSTVELSGSVVERSQRLVELTLYAAASDIRVAMRTSSGRGMERWILPERGG
ncbi:hypothetical protein V6N13_125746 [Hibiscus sabdariffa]